MTTLIVVIILAVLIALTVWACCKVSAESAPSPCRDCEQEYCHDCGYWKEMTGDADC